MLRSPDARLGWLVGITSFCAYLIGAGRSYGYDASVTVGQFIRQGDPLHALTHAYALNNHVAFSVIESVIWRLGGRSEAPLRVLPALCAAVTVGLVTTWVAHRHGPLAGMVSGFIMAFVPQTTELARDVRGYSLVTLCLTIAAMVVVADVRTNRGVEPTVGPHRWDRRHVLVTIAIALAMGAHLFAAIAVLGIVTWALAADRHAWNRWSQPWILGAVVGLAIQLPTLPDVAGAAKLRSGTIVAGLPIRIGRELLGRNLVAITILSAVVLVAVIGARRPGRPAALASATAVVVPCSLMWLVVHPTDLYPRFFGWLVPLVAVAVGSVVGRWPVIALPIGAAVMSMLVAQVPDWSQDPLPNREIVRYFADHPVQGPLCADRYWGETLMGYDLTTNAMSDPDRVARCGALIGPVEDWDTPLVVAARSRMTERITFDSVSGAWFVLR